MLIKFTVRVKVKNFYFFHFQSIIFCTVFFLSGSTPIINSIIRAKSMIQKIDEISEHVKQVSGFIPSLLQELAQVMVGQKYLTERLVLGLLVGEHILLEGVPGLAKTTSVKTLAQSVKSDFKRIQFTPDLLPADLLGTQV